MDVPDSSSLRSIRKHNPASTAFDVEPLVTGPDQAHKDFLRAGVQKSGYRVSVQELLDSLSHMHTLTNGIEIHMPDQNLLSL